MVGIDATDNLDVNVDVMCLVGRVGEYDAMTLKC